MGAAREQSSVRVAVKGVSKGVRLRASMDLVWTYTQGPTHVDPHTLTLANMDPHTHLGTPPTHTHTPAFMLALYALHAAHTLHPRTTLSSVTKLYRYQAWWWRGWWWWYVGGGGGVRERDGVGQVWW